MWFNLIAGIDRIVLWQNILICILIKLKTDIKHKCMGLFFLKTGFMSCASSTENVHCYYIKFKNIQGIFLTLQV